MRNHADDQEPAAFLVIDDPTSAVATHRDGIRPAPPNFAWRPSAPPGAAFSDRLQDSRLRNSGKSVRRESRPLDAIPFLHTGEKLAHIHRQWDGLQTFLHDGRVETDSNGVENLIRPIALNRKDALFAGHDEGGKAWCGSALKWDPATLDIITRRRCIFGTFSGYHRRGAVPRARSDL